MRSLQIIGKAGFTLKNLRKPRKSFLTLTALFLLLANFILTPLAFAGYTVAPGGKATAGGKKATAKTSQDGQAQGPREISPEGQRQISALIAEKNSRTPAQRKIASQLLQGVREARGEEITPGVNLEKVNLKVADGKVTVDITATVSDSLLKRIEQLDGTIIFPSAQFRAIRALVPLSAVETIAGYSEVTFIRTAVPSKTRHSAVMSADTESAESDSLAPPTSAGFIGPILPTGLAALSLPFHPSFAARAANVRNYLSKVLGAKAAGAGFIGQVTSEGVKAMQADTGMAQYGFEGEGIKIAVLSDSFNYLGGAATDVATGDLPGPGNPFGNTTPVTVVQDLPPGNLLAPGSDEGRAMMQIVHDMAPKAQLFFATADISEAGFATNIETLRTVYGCDIICDDVGYFDESPFSDSLPAQAVNVVTAAGAIYFSAAGNSGNVFSNTQGAWEGDFTDAGSAPLAVLTPFESGGGTIMNWGTMGSPLVGNVIKQRGGQDYTLDWADPLGASTNDYDLFVLNSAGQVKLASTNVQDGSEDPHEEIDSPSFATNDEMVIFKSSTAAVRALDLDDDSDSENVSPRLNFTTGGATRGHPCAAAAFGVAAVGALQAGNTTAGVFTTASNVETFSSDGPRRMFFNGDGSPVSPGNFTFASGGFVTRQKPDVAGADNVSTTNVPGLTPFLGTSAATPHCAAVAGLLKSANPTLSAAQIRTILTTLSDTINIDDTGAVGTAGGPLPNPTVGSGILNANAIMATGIATAGSPGDMADIALGTVSVSEGTFSNLNGFIDPGEVAKVVVQLTNPSLTPATGVSATLTTTTPGITISTGTVSYGTITAGGSVSNTGTPFQVGVGSSVLCGTSVSLQLNVTLADGIPLTFPFSFGVGSTIATITGNTIGTTPTSGSGYTATGGTKLGTLARAGGSSSCTNIKSAPLSGTGFSATVGGRYAAFTFTNSNAASQCVTVTVTSAVTAALQTAVFNNSGFVATGATASLAHGTNYLADPGTRAGTMTYSFTAPGGGQQFTVVVYDATTAGNAAGTDGYTVSVSLATCTAGPTCSAVTIGPTTIAPGIVETPYSQTFTVTGGSSNSIISISGGLPAGLSLSGKTLSGTPTQAGAFPITVTATDDAGCPTTPKSYSLVINGTLPGTVTATAGAGQSALVGASFATNLQATVLDGGSHPLSGVNVLFTAPSSGATGTFTGGVSTATVVTGPSGVATAPTFTANTTSGGYTVTASVVGVTTPASFGLMNSCPGSFIVTNNQDSGPGSLRAVITNACNGAVVTFAPNVTGAITLTSGQLDIEKSVTISGPGANVLAVSGGGQSRVFAIGLSNVANTVIISGLTITNGETLANGTDFFGGGGVLINAGTVNLTDDAITNNDCSNSGVPFGGGVDNEGTGLVTITRCSITGNTTNDAGGGIFTEGTSMLIIETTIAGNSAGVEGVGGGLLVATSTTMLDSTVYGNSANAGGNVSPAAVLVNNPVLSFGDSIIAGGILIGDEPIGADLFPDGGSLTSLDYNLIQDTTAGGSPVTIGGTKTHNITSVSPNLLALANYGGPTQSLLPAANSPAINAGNPTASDSIEQRALPRVTGGREDIGAVETDYVLTATSGGGQSAVINTAFAQPLKATVTESGNDIAGITVAFTPPVSGQSCVFAAGTPVTSVNGVATSTTLTANGTSGTYSVTASIGSAIPTVSYSLTNGTCATISVGPATIPSGTVGSAYTSTQFTQTGGVGTVTFTETGSLDGLSLSTAGVLSGTPAATGSFPVTVTATDSHSCTGSKGYTISIGCSTITVTPTTVPVSLEFEPYQVQFTHTGGVGAVTFTTASTLPTGVHLSTAGLLSGTPTQGGVFSITVKATDSKGCTGTVTVSLNVSSLNMCLHDDHTGDFIQFSSTTGAYLFTQCSPAVTVSGTGTIKMASGVLTITDKETSKTVTITFNTGALTGNAVITVSSGPGLTQTYKITDTNPHPVCSCATP
jgi:hypothetical protein